MNALLASRRQTNLISSRTDGERCNTALQCAPLLLELCYSMTLAM